MSRRICLLFLAVSFALAAPATSLAQSSSQAQYQGVAPETSTPVTGSGATPGGGSAGTTSSSGGGTTGTGGSTATGGKGTTSGASGNGGSGASAPASSGAAGQSSAVAVTPETSSDTAPFSGGDFVWILLACAGLAGLGFLLRRATRSPAGT
jgi:cobalamin biosynthesis Mg chelatase CobN